MIIHVVRPGESVYTISRLYGVSPDRIIHDNELVNPNNLAVGQTLVILEGMRTHTAAPGETLYSIAARYGVSVQNLMSANPQVTNPSLIHPGQVLVIPPRTEKIGTIDVNGYAFPSISMEVLGKTLPHLTFLSVFSYNVNPDGSLVEINDIPLIQAARRAGTAPFMVITNRGFNSDVASSVLNSTAAQDTLLRRVTAILKEKNYFGLNIDFEYVYPSDRENYNNFLRRASMEMRSLGYQVSSALAPKLSGEQRGLQYEAHDYPVHGRLMDHVIIMTYEWGFTFGPPLAVAPLNEVVKVLDYAVSVIPAGKILMGIPNYGYDWTLPYVHGTAAETLSHTGAVDRAFEQKADIHFDPLSQAPYFTYYDRNGRQHIVWFEDARSNRAKLLLVNRFNLGGVSYWTIGSFFPQNWLVLNSLYNVRKVL